MIQIMTSGKMILMMAALCFAMFCSCNCKPAVTVSEKDNGSTVEIKNGEILAVKLPAQLGTGFSWKVASSSKALEQKGEPAQTPPDEPKPGGAEYQTFSFKAAEKGEIELKLQYAQGWDKDPKPLKEFVVRVIVK